VLVEEITEVAATIIETLTGILKSGINNYKIKINLYN
jgi:hypothetical protein